MNFPCYMISSVKILIKSLVQNVCCIVIKTWSFGLNQSKDICWTLASLKWFNLGLIDYFSVLVHNKSIGSFANSWLTYNLENINRKWPWLTVGSRFCTYLVEKNLTTIYKFVTCIHKHINWDQKWTSINLKYLLSPLLQTKL